MSTCPIYLDECEQLRLNDSILIKNQDKTINKLQAYKKEQSEIIAKKDIKIVKLRWNVVKGVLFGSIGGFIAALFVVN